MLTMGLGRNLRKLLAIAPLLTVFVFADSVGAAGPPVPASSTAGISNLTYSSVILHGFVNPRGQVSSYYFQYGPTKAYGAQSPLASAGNGTATVKVDQAITGLAPGFVYHYRIVAMDAAGHTVGADHSFKTPKIPLSLQIVGVPNPTVFGSPFTMEGTLSGTGASTREVVLQGRAFPYTAAFTNLGTPQVTAATGAFSFGSLGLSENTQLRVITVGSPVIVSPIVTEQVAVKVTFHVHRTHTHGIVRFSGTVTPAEAGALVGFQLLKPGHKSINEGGTAVKAATSTTSTFSRRVHLRHKGVYRALIQVKDGAHVSNYSEPIFVR